MARATLETKLSLDDTSFKAGLRGAGMASQKFAKDSGMAMAKSVAAFAGGTLAVGALVRKFSQLSEEFDRFGKLATRFDMPVETVQKFALAAELSGTSIERMNSALTKATVAGVEASKGMKSYADAFADLNIDVAAFNQLSPDEKIRVLGEAFNNAEDEAVAFAAAYRILGKAGADLVPMLRDVAGAMDQAGDARFLSEDQVRRVEEMNDRMTVLSTTLKTDLMEAFLALEPVITKMVDLVGDFARGINSLTGGPGVDDPTSGAYVEPGGALEPFALADRASNLRRNIPNLEGKEKERAERDLARVMQRINGLEERGRDIARTEMITRGMRESGSSQEAIDAFVRKRTEMMERKDKAAGFKDETAAAGSVMDEVYGKVGKAQARSAGVPAASAGMFGPVPMPAGGLYNAAAMDAASNPTFEDLTNGGGVSAKMFEAHRAAMVAPIFKARGTSTRGRAMLGGGLDGIAAEGSSFGSVGFGGLAASMNAAGNQRIGDPRKLGGDKEAAMLKLDAGEKQIQLLEEQNELLRANLMVK